jgi:hypothetical protein
MSDLEIAAYLDHGLPAEKLDAIEEHLVSCDICRASVVESQELLNRSRRSRRFVTTATFLVAAAAITLVAIPSIRRSTTSERDVLRITGSEAALKVYGPIGEVRATPSRFVWGSTAGALSYHLTITTGTGADVWSASLTDTTIALPEGISLQPGQKYLWAVDAVAADGTTRTTGLREFEIVP